MRKVILLPFAFLLLTVNCFAKDINFELSADRNRISLGSSGQLYLTFNGTQGIPALELSATEGLRFNYLGPSTRMSIVNGQASSSITHVYTFFPLKTGTFKIGPLKFEYKGDNYVSNQINMEVVQGPTQPDTNSIQQQEGAETKDISDRIFLVMEVKKNRAYLNETIPLTIKLYVNKLAVRDIQFPDFNHDGFSVGQFEQPKQYQDVLNGVNYEVIEFNTSIFGLRPGEFHIGPGNLKCNLIVSKAAKRQNPSGFDDFFGADVFDDFFGKYDTFALNLKAPEVPMVVFDLPETNKPLDFSGAVGEFDMDVSIKPQEVKVGDPLTLKMTISGEGNFNTVNAPKLASEAGFKVYEPQVKQEASQKVFEQVLMPLNETIKEIPPINFSFFNTRTGAYQSVSRGPFPISVLKPEKEEAARIVENPQGASASIKEEKLGRDIIFIKASPGNLRQKGKYLYNNPLFLWLQVLPVFSFLFFFIFHRLRRKLQTDIKYARRLAAPKKARQGLRRAKSYFDAGNTKAFYDTVFETLQEYLGDKFHLPSKGITVSIISDSLKNKGVSEAVLAELKDIFNECDLARYSAVAFQKDKMGETLKKLEEVIDSLQRQKV